MWNAKKKTHNRNPAGSRRGAINTRLLASQQEEFTLCLTTPQYATHAASLFAR